MIDLTGRRFGKWVVLAEGPPVHYTNKYGKNAKRRWHCRCDCGSEELLTQDNLTRGKSVSCGCTRSQIASDRFTVHGHTQGYTESPEYRVWMSMRGRCGNPNNQDYARYGGRGITVCERWQDFANFIADVGPRPSPLHTMDRIDGNKGYEPGNVRWATWKEQQNNRSNNYMVEFDGKRLNLTQWSEIVGIRRATLRSRLERGWSPEKALTTHRFSNS